MDLATVSAIALGSAAIIGLFLTVMQLRQLIAQRRTDMLIRLSPWFRIDFQDLQSMSNAILSSEFKDYEDFVKRYGELNIDQPLQNSLATMSNFYEGLGILLKRRLVDEELIRDLYGGMIVATWERMLPLVPEVRKRSPSSWDNFEYLYGEMKKGEPPA
ncbi:MAG: DUF4760 domain-containing protein [Methanomassiliicoccales archaeon]